MHLVEFNAMSPLEVLVFGQNFERLKFADSNEYGINLEYISVEGKTNGYFYYLLILDSYINFFQVARFSL